MRLIGGRDYYDSALAYGRDTDVVFVRSNPIKIAHEKYVAPYKHERKEETFDKRVRNIASVGNKHFIPFKNGISMYRSYKDNVFELKSKHYRFTFFTCIVAGKQYGGVRFEEFNNFQTLPSFFWSFDTFDKFLTNTLELEYEPKNHYGCSWDKNSVLNHFTNTTTDVDWLIDNRVTTIVPIFNDTEYCYIVNGDNLKTVDFVKRLNPYQCFQEISMWVSGVLPRSGNPMVEITDNKIKIHKAGFDTKTSFRKMSRVS